MGGGKGGGPAEKASRTGRDRAVKERKQENKK